MLNQNHCNVRSPISIDRKYPGEDSETQSFAADAHILKNTNPDDYSVITTSKDSNPKEIEK